MSVAAGYIATILIAGIGFMISQEVADLWDKWVISRTRVLTEEDEDLDG
jgi:hypothetical protein